MSDYFTEVSRDTFLISFKSKVDDNKFFGYVEKNFKKWGMVDIDYDKKEKTIIGKTPFFLSSSFWRKFPVKLNFVGLKSIIISKGDKKNSFLINVNTNETFGNSHTIRFPTYFSKEINSKFAKLIINKLTADEKIANVKKKNQPKLVWWILGIFALFILLNMMDSGGNKSENKGSRVICVFEGQVDNKPYKFQRECVYTCYAKNIKERVLRYETMPSNCPTFPKMVPYYVK